MKNVFLISLLILLLSCQNQQYENFMPMPEESQLYSNGEIESGNWDSNSDQSGFTYSTNQENSKLLAGNLPPQTSPPPPPPQQPKTNQSPKKEATKKKIIKTVSLNFEVEKYAETRKSINDFLAKTDAYISNENEQNNTYSIQNSLTIRVKPENLDGLIADLEGLAEKVLRKQISARDVTSEFLDIEIRIKTKREVIERYRELLKQAKNVEEILAVEEELRQVIEEVESQEGRLKYLRNQIGWSTINLSITEYFERPTNEKSFFAKLGNAFGEGWGGFLSFTVGLISIWPFVILIIGLIYLIRKFWRRKKTNSPNA